MYTEPPVHHLQPPPGLDAWLDALDPTREPAVRLADLKGVSFVIKRRQPSFARGVNYLVRYLRASVLALFCRLLLSEWPSPRTLVYNGLAHEASRLRGLTHTGCRVPAVWRYRRGELVLEFVGEGMPHLLRQAGPAARRALVDEIAADLAQFHRAGHWHGGAQLRNLTRRDNAIWRLDFEENIGATLSLPLAQAYDVYQCLASMVVLRYVPADETAALADQLLTTYLALNPAPDMRRSLTRIARVLNGVATLLMPLRWLPGRDVRGFFRSARSLRLLLIP